MSITKFKPIASVLLLLCPVIVGSGFTPVHAATKPIVTVTGKEIYPNEVINRLSRTLHALKEPSWRRQELQKLGTTVFAYLKVFTGSNFEKTLATLHRGDKYRPMIRAKLKEYKLPQPFEALPMAESAYRFNALSNQQAYGLWQIIPASAQRYGLTVRTGLDQRANPVLSTDAALKYLKEIHAEFGKISALLSIAAYNAGEGRIRSIVRKSGVNAKQRGYSRIVNHLPRETQGYIPEFLASAILLQAPEKFGFPVSEKPKHSFVQIPKPIPVRKIAYLTKLPVTAIRKLNPELDQRHEIPVSDFIIRLPGQSARSLNRNIPASITWLPTDGTIDLEPPILPDSDLIYFVRKGNHLGGIAQFFNVKIEDLRTWNNISGNKIRAGQRLIVKVKTPTTRKKYRIQAGDNLELIARHLGVSIDHLRFFNGNIDPRRLRLGDNLFYYDQQA